MADDAILVLGATGTTGRRVADWLTEAGHHVRRASRSGEVPFDWGRPDTWEPALAGAHGVYVMAPDGVAIDPAFIALAENLGVRRLVLLSSDGIEEMNDERLLTAERTVRGSSLAWTILRPSWFDQNFDEGFLRAGVMDGLVLLPVGDLRFALVDAADIAVVAAHALTSDAHAGRMYEPCGPQALSFADAVQTISRALGRAVRFDGTSAAYADSLVADGLGRHDADGVVASFEALQARGDDTPNDLVETVTGRAPTTFDAYLAAAATRGAWRR